MEGPIYTIKLSNTLVNIGCHKIVEWHAFSAYISTYHLVTAYVYIFITII